MTGSDIRSTLDWGWTSYHRCGFASPLNGRRLYGAHFRADNSAPLGWQTLYIQFWARRPIVALREIVTSKRDPNEYSGAIVN